LSYRVYRVLTTVVYPAAAGWAALHRGSGREEWAERMGRLPRAARGGVWVHAASVGELVAAGPLVRALASRGEEVYLTVVTPSGRRTAEGSLDEHATLSFAPLDFVPSVRRALDAVSPRAVLLVETELWPNLIVEAVRLGAVVGVVNGRLSERSARRYALPGSPLRGAADLVSFVACQSGRDRSRFLRVGFPDEKVQIAGNTKFDALPRPLPEAEKSALRASLGIPEGSPVVVLGSVRPLEEGTAVGAAREVLSRNADAHVVVAPRHLDRAPALVSALDAAGVPSARRSDPGAGRAEESRAVVLDTTGELSRVYAIADVAFVGGSLGPYGGHNPLEPAAHGVPVLFGPHTESCRDSAERLLAAGGGSVVGRDELAASVLGLLEDPAERETMASGAIAAVESGRGATERTLVVLESAGVIER
jgi:3-deoxy-D-manno-octulosonic-acid transferase